MPSWNARSKNQLEEHKNDTFITPTKHIKLFGKLYADLLEDYSKFTSTNNDILVIDLCCGIGEFKNNLFNNVRSSLQSNFKNIYLYSNDIDNIKIINTKDCYNTILNEIINTNFYKTENNLYILILMNPPFNHKNMFIDISNWLHSQLTHFLADKIVNLKDIMISLLLPNTSFGSLERCKLWKDNPPYLVGYNRRPQFIKNKSSNLDCSWFVISNMINRNYLLEI
jgi:hypothetical protein